MIDTTLQQYASPRQWEYYCAVNQYGSQAKAAKALGVARPVISRAITALREKAARAGYAPSHDFTHPTAPGFDVKRVSTNYGDEGQINQQWVIQEQDKKRIHDAFVNAVENMATEWKPLKPIKKVTKDALAELLTLYTFTDYHIGQYSYGKETGEDWDILIAERVLIEALSGMMRGSPDSQLAVLNIQGDFQHWDGLAPVTPTAGNLLDADTRFEKMVELSLRVSADMTVELLKKHEKVKVIICEGNHDLASSVWMRKSLKELFKDNPRVEIDDTAFPFYAHLHGEIMIGFHHGHKVKNKNLPALFAAEPRYREMWGKAKYTYIHTGHYHHAEQDMAESGGAIVERHPTLAARDAHSTRGGYVSWRAARAITYHITKGEHSRTTVVPA